MLLSDTADEPTRFAAAELLWEACRRVPDTTAVRAAVDAGAAAQTVVPLAMWHGVGPLLWRALGAAGVSEMLGPYEKPLMELSELGRLEALLLLPDLVAAAVGPLVEAGFEPVILKGPWLAARYPSPGLRSMGDIDLLLPDDQHLPAIAALERAGWRVVRAMAADRYDTVLSHPSFPKPLELHFHVEVHHLRVTEIDAAELWARRMAVDCLGTAAFALPPSVELVALAQHAGKPFHSFNRLIWLADFAMVVGHERDLGQKLDWELVDELAGRWRCRTMVHAAMAMTRRIGVDYPPGLVSLPDRGWRADALGCLLDPTWPLSSPNDDATYHLRFALTDRWTRRLRLLVGSRFVMSEVSRLRWALDVPGQTLLRTWRWVKTMFSLGRRRALGLHWAPSPASTGRSSPLPGANDQGHLCGLR